MTNMLELLDKDFKEAMIKMLQWAIVNMLETNEKTIDRLIGEIESLSKK